MHIHDHEIVKGIRADVGKIGHMKELQQLEILFYNSMDIPGLLAGLNKHIDKNIDLESPLKPKDLQGVDSYVKSFFENKIITENELWIVRGFVIGKLLETQEKLPTIYQPLIDINKLPKNVKDAAKEYGLTLRETKALEYTVSEGMKNLTNASLETVRRANSILFDNIKTRKGTKALTDALYEEFSGDEGEVNRNWKRVSIFSTNNAFNQGFISQVKHGEWVYGLSLKDRCEHCGALIDGKFYPVIRIPAEDLNYENLKPDSAEYKRRAWIHQNGIWTGKDNIGRSGSKKKRIDSDTGNKKENLTEREAHELYCPVIPVHPYCMPEKTKVTMADGTFKNIEDVEKEDEVLSVQRNIRVVLGTSERFYIGIMYEVEIENRTILKLTRGHQIYTDKETKKPVEDLSAGEYIQTTDGKSKIYKIKWYQESIFVYNIEVESDHSFFANEIGVENCRCRWMHFYPDTQYIDSNGDIKLRLMNEGDWKKFYDKHIQPIIHEFAKRGIKL